MPETTRTVADVIALRVGELEADLGMVDQRLAAVRWGTVTSRRRTGNLSWPEVAFNTAATRDDDDSAVLASEVLNHRRAQILHELSALRARLLRTCWNGGSSPRAVGADPRL